MAEKNVVICAQGALRGKELGGVTGFLGVPFAMPPVGSLRWREPQPPQPWRGIRSAEQFGAGPIQSFGFEKDGIETAWLSEDCLYLNIWTADTGAKMPVYVWFYGGSYQAGRGDDETIRGLELAKKGVVTVTVNYRVNVFGFLCHPDMKKESPYGTGGNFGLLDQIASLRWLKENIAAFGGDPERITIGGHSAGSASVNNLLCSPLSRDLIAGAVNESGDVFQPERDVTFDQCCAGGTALAEHFGVKTLDELRRLPASEFVRMRFDVMGQLHQMCTPVIDGVVIPYAQGNMLLRNDCAQVPILLGSNFDEGSGGGPGYVDRVLKRLGVDRDLYPADEREATRQVSRDYWYGRHYAWARIRSEKYGLPLYHYVFSRQDGQFGAMHGAEIPYAFRTIDDPAANHRHDGGYGAEDHALMETLSGYWVNFIKTGDPNGEGLPHWEKKGPGVGHLRLDLDVGMEQDFLRPADEKVLPACYAWMKKRSDGEIDG